MATNNKKFVIKNGLAVGGASGIIDIIDSNGTWVGATGILHGATGPAGSNGATGAGVNGASGLTGATGVIQNWIVKTTTYTAVSKDAIAADTSGGAFTISLPATPTSGDSITIADSGHSFNTNNLTIARNGSTIETQSQDLVVDIANVIVSLIYNGTTWKVFSTVGIQGASGAAGTNGTNGATGAAGSNGTNGATGPTGATGAGVQGATGSAGTNGATGSAGTNGATGFQGIQGASGVDGSNGTNGATGSAGVNGATGSVGSVGATGIDGATGSAGTNGATGLTGATGAGVQGASGATGIQGPAGQSASYYSYKAKTSSQSGDPGSGYITWNNATILSANTLQVSHLTNDTFDIDIFLGIISIGDTLIIQEATDSSRFQKWQVTGTPVAYVNQHYEYPVTLLDSGGTALGNNDALILAVISTPIDGATGSQGVQGATGSAGTNGATGVQGATGVTGSNGTNGATGPTGVSGATGIIQNWSVKTTTYTAVNKDAIAANTSGGAFTITLPATPSTGDSVTFADSGHTFVTNNLTIARNGSTIESSATDFIIDVSNVFVSFIYDGTTWRVFSTVGVQGASGASGSAGTNGATGSAGSNGTNGATGIQGASGASGAAGTNGATGSAGTNGATGVTGSNGTNGATGSAGTNGATGVTGSNGTNGATGPTGVTGATGIIQNWMVKTTTYTAVNKDAIAANTSGGAFTITLPASPSTGDSVTFADSGHSFSTNNLTIARNGSTIESSATDLIADVSNVFLSLIYDGSTWRAFTTVGVQGASGAAGTNGATGSAGTIGTNGATGSAGTNGATGVTGSNGTNGATGSAGSNGTNGATGSAGTNGATGAAGSNGTNGATGVGLTGATGPAGTGGGGGSSANVTNLTSVNTDYYAGFIGSTGPLTDVYLANANVKYNPSTTLFSAPFVNVTGTITGSLTSGAISYGTLNYSDVNLMASFASSVNTYNQVLLQNGSNGTSASANFVVSNDLATNSTSYGDFGMNSSGFNGGSDCEFHKANTVYVAAQTADLAIGTYGTNNVHFIVNNSTVDSMTINANNSIQVNAPFKVTTGATGFTGATGAIGAPSAYFNSLYVNGTSITSGGGGGGASITDDTTTNASYYPAMYSATSGTPTTVYTSSSKIYFNPSTGTLNSTIYNSLSDENKKKNIKTIGNAIDTINQLNGVEFDWKDTGVKSYGVIAQEIEKILPHLVTMDDQGNKSVNYNGLFGFLINAIKEQQKQIDDLKGRN